MYFQLPGVEQISDEAGSSPKLLVTLEEVDGQLKSVKEEEVREEYRNSGLLLHDIYQGSASMLFFSSNFYAFQAVTLVFLA